MNDTASLESLLGNADGHRISLLSEPYRITAEYIERHSSLPIFSYGIVNPFGPTLQTILAVRDGTRAPLTLVSARLHPFVPIYELIGHVRLAARGQREFESDLINAIVDSHREFDDCATLLIESPVLRQDQTLFVAQSLLMRRQRLALKLALVRQYLGDPWSRVSVETGDAELNLVGAGRPELLPVGAEQQAAELATILLSKEHCGEELRAFVSAWSGAIRFNQDHGGSTPVELTLDGMLDLLGRLTTSSEGTGTHRPRQDD
jgi:hypothetical protein